MKYSAVIYDLDGTLLNTLDDLAAAVNHALAEGSFPLRTVEEVRCFVGNGMERLIRLSLPQGASEETFQLTLKRFKDYYALHSNDLTKPYPGIMEVLQTLKNKGVPQAVVSNKGDPFVKELCQLYFDGLMDAAVGEQAGVRRKPAPDSLLKVMEQLHLSPAEVLYVGDSEVDVLTARNAHVDCLSVCWGFRTQEELLSSGAVSFAHSAREVAERVLEN